MPAASYFARYPALSYMSSKICRKRPSYFFRIVFLVLRYSGLRAHALCVNPVKN